jgi:hypothetical protein
METKKPTQRTNETKKWFFEKIDEVDEPLTTVTKESKKIQINKIKDEEEETEQRWLEEERVKISEKAASPGHNNTSLKNGDQEEGKGNKGIKK